MSSNHLIEQLRSAVDQNLQNEQFGVEELAESVNMSRSNLHRKLQEASSQSVSQFIREYRLEKALEILKNEDVTVSEVSSRVGFGSSSYFSKTFTEVYGYPPIEAKKHLFSSEDPSKPAKPHLAWSKLAGAFALVIIGIYAFWILYKKSPISEAIEGPITMAIIPFKNLNKDSSNEYFADGVMDALLTKLAKVNQLQVTSRTSVEQFRNTTLPIPEIAQNLNVSYIIEGSAQKYGNQIKVVVQLIDTERDVPIWSSDYTRPFEDILHLQGEIAEIVTGELKIALSIEDQIEVRSSPTQNPEAYNKYLMAVYQHFRYSNESLNEAITLFQEVIEMDPGFVDAYVNLGEIWTVYGASWGLLDQTEAWSNARRMLEKALELDPDNTTAMDVLATGIFWYEWNAEKADELYEKARSIRGFDGDWTKGYYTKTDQNERALHAGNRMIAINPLDSWNYYEKAQALYFLGRNEEALEVMKYADSRFDDFLLKREIVKLYCFMGQEEKFIDSYLQLINNFGDRPPLLLWLGAMHAYMINTDMQPFISQLLQRYSDNTSGSPAWFLALIYAAIGDDAQLFDWLEKSYDRQEVEMTWLKMEPSLQPYKDDPRYLDLMTRMNFPK